MMTRLGLGLGCLLMISFATACGDDTSATGGGGSGGGTTAQNGTGTATGGTTGAGSPTSSSTGTGVNVTVAQCTEECTEAQAGMCTGIIGECMTCCAAGLNVAPAAGCVDELEAYYECLSSAPNACDAACDEMAFQDCMVGYCINNLMQPDCMTLAGCVDIGGG